MVLEDLEARMARLCWACGREAEDPSSLKTCTECRVAKYCDRWIYRVLQLDTGCSDVLSAGTVRGKSGKFTSCFTKSWSTQEIF